MSNVEDLIANPKRHFGQPREVLEDPRLTAADKLKVLESWKQDASRLSDSTAENMSGGEESDLREVSKALLELKEAEPSTASKPKRSSSRGSGTGGSGMTGSLAIGAMLGAGAGLVAVAVTGPSLSVVVQTTVAGLILGGVVATVRRTAA